MNTKQWEIINKCARMESVSAIPAALIVDSPWIPGYLGISTLDYFTLPDLWLESNLQIKRDFPEIIFLPDFWIEYGMAAEPSGFGTKSVFYQYKTPNLCHIISSVDDVEQMAELTVPNPRTDGLMPFILSRYKNAEPKLKEFGESIKIVCARGPLTIASYLMSVTEFLMALKLEPEATHKLLKTTTTLVTHWLEAQAEVLSEVEGIMVLDDIVGFLSEEDYLEFAHPYLKSIFSSFPGCLKIYHNDNESTICYKHIKDTGANIFNFSHKNEISGVRALVGNEVCLMGNVAPLDDLASGTPEMVRNSVFKELHSHGSNKGLILSAGGGVSPGTPKENIRALIDAVSDYNRNLKA